jgi:protein gp37
MAQRTGIEWTDLSSNPIRAVRKSDGKRGHACVHASPGCVHCYSERWNGWRGTGLKFNVPALEQVDIILDEKELARMRRVKAGNKVFVCDMTDLFGPFVPDEYIAAVFAAMIENDRATWQVLTKRPERLASWVQHNLGAVPDHIWVGTSVESQEYADKRIPHLLRVPAAVRFLSCEPLLGPVDLCREWLDGIYTGEPFTDSLGNTHTRATSGPCIHWVVVGGESGPGARPAHPNWFRALRDQCVAAAVAFHFKQHGAYIHETQIWRRPEACSGVVSHDAHNVLMTGNKEPADRGWQHEDRSISYQVGKKAAGRLLDGRTWDEFPTPAASRVVS